jgi:hypothetical protein
MLAAAHLAALRSPQIKKILMHHETPSPKMPLLRPRNALLLCCLAIACVYAEKASSSVAFMSIPEIEEKLQVGSSLATSCYLVL